MIDFYMRIKLSVHLADFCFEAVQVIRDIVPVLGSEITNKVLNAVSPLLTSTDLDKRVFICDLLEALARADPSVQFVVLHESLFLFLSY